MKQNKNHEIQERVLAEVPANRSGEIKLNPNSPEFEALIRRCLPPEWSADVVAQWKNSRTRTTVLERLSGLFLILLIAVGAWLIFPTVTPPALTAMEELKLNDPTPPLPPDSQYLRLYQEQLKHYQDGKSETAADALKSAALSLAEEHRSDHFKLPFLYFNALRDSGRTAGVRDGKALSLLIAAEPDELSWRYLRFQLNASYRRAENYREIKQAVLRGEYQRNWSASAAEIRCALAEIATMKLKLKTLRNKDQREQTSLRLDCSEAALRTSLWLLTGGGGLPRWDDDEDDPGVDEREKAFQIARSHESLKRRDFWELRYFIAQTLIEQNGWFPDGLNRIYWNGESRNLRKIEQEKERCQTYLNRNGE